MEFTAQATYNRSTQGMASQRYALRVVPGSRFDLSAGYEAYSYKDLFQTALHPVFVTPSAVIDNTDKVRTIFGVMDWEFVSGVDHRAGGEEHPARHGEPREREPRGGRGPLRL